MTGSHGPFTNTTLTHDDQGHIITASSGAGGGGMTSFNLDGDNTTPQTVHDGETAYVYSDGIYLTATAAAARKVTISHNTTGVVGMYTYPSMVQLDDAGHVTVITGGSALGVGDMLKATYDSDNDGVIALAQLDPLVATTAMIWNSIWKTSEQTKNNDNALAADSELQFSMSANKDYIIKGEIFYRCTANSDFKFSITGGQGTGYLELGFEGHVHSSGTDNVSEYHVAPSASATYVASTAIAPTSHTSGYVRFTITVRTTGAGTFRFNWAQNTSHNDTTAVRAGSYLMYKQVN